MLSSATPLHIGNDVFCRPEGTERFFLLRPGGRAGPLVRLVREPGRTWWGLLEKGLTPGEWLERARRLEGRDGEAEAFLVSLMRDGFIAPCAGRAEPSAAPLPEMPGIFEDPWAYQFSQPSLWSPWYVLWEVTNQCMRNCSYCYNPDQQDLHVGLDQACLTVSELARNFVPFVTLLGGEPFLNAHLPKIVALLHSTRVYTKVITNGVAVTREKVNRLREAGLDQIALSLDGLTPESNDLTRGPGAFDHFARARRIIGREIPMVTLSLTVSTATIAQLDRLGDFSREWDLDETYLSQLRDLPGNVYPDGVRPLGPDQISQVNAKAKRLNEDGAKVIGLKRCSCGRSSAVIQADGTLRPCPFAVSRAADPAHGDLALSWFRIASRAERMGPVSAGPACYLAFVES